MVMLRDMVADVIPTAIYVTVAAGLPSSPCGLRRGEKQLVRRRLGEGNRACRIFASNTAGRDACRYL
jgi:hypothetical protein